MHRVSHPLSFVERMYISRAQGGSRLLIDKDCVELKRSNLSDFAANSNERHLKAATEELMATRKNNERMEGESIAWSIPERKRGNVTSKEMPVVRSRWDGTGHWQP